MNVESGKNEQRLDVSDVLTNVSFNIHFFISNSKTFLGQASVSFGQFIHSWVTMELKLKLFSDNYRTQITPCASVTWASSPQSRNFVRTFKTWVAVLPCICYFAFLIYVFILVVKCIWSTGWFPTWCLTQPQFKHSWGLRIKQSLMFQICGLNIIVVRQTCWTCAPGCVLSITCWLWNGSDMYKVD